MGNNERRTGVEILNDNQKIFGVFHRPAGEGPFPAVLICHGFAGTKVGKHRMYVRLSEALSSRGIASLRIDFRGCGDSEGAFTATTFESQVSDALRSLDYLKRNAEVDATRLGLLGRSMGGPIVVATAARCGCIKSLALWCSVFSAKPWQQVWEKADTKSETIPFQGQLASRDLFRQLFALNLDEQLNSLKEVPLLHIHSDLDTVVAVSHAEEFRRCRQGSEPISQFIRLKESDHEFSSLSEQDYSIKETAKWFHKTV